jgi:SanA protein
MWKLIERIIRVGFRVTAGVMLAAAISPFALRGLVALVYRDDTFTYDQAPEARVALIFGARVYPGGRPSAMLADRVATGADLYHAGKVDILLFSGDGREASYNEPESMKRYALSLGVPESAIVLDYAGLRTYDSCYRARHIFGVEEAILVTQNFHLDRALFTCNLLGVKSDGVFADYQRPWGYSSYSLSYSRTREIAAITVALWDVIRREPATVGGEPLPLQ